MQLKEVDKPRSKVEIPSVPHTLKMSCVLHQNDDV